MTIPEDNEDDINLYEVAELKQYTIDEINDILKVIVPGLYPSWRTNQLEVVQQIINSNKKYIGIQAPPGFGKSGSAIGELIASGGRGITVTQTKQLGDQYYRDFYQLGLQTVKGRGNFSCTIIPDKTAADAPCVAGMKCLFKRGGCEYYDQKRQAVDSKLVSMNIHYFLNEANYSGEFSDVDTIFIDEAQKLDSSMLSFIEVRLNYSRFSDEGKPIPKDLSINSLKEWSDSTIGTIKSELDQVLEELEQNPQNEILTVRGIRLKAAYNSLLRFEIVDETWIIEQEENNVILKPTLVGKYMEKFLFQHAKRIIFMSATLPRSIIEGFNVVDYEYINLPSTFDPEKRPVIWIPAANLAQSAKDPGVELKRLTLTVDALLNRYPDQKGIIHTVNYKIANHLMENSENTNRLRTHINAKERAEVLRDFSSNQLDNNVLVSPSFTEGVDLPYDLCRFQLICKIPYDSLANKQIKARMEIDSQWYATNAIVTMVQAYGRAMRAEDDSGTVSYTHLRAPRDRTISRMPSSA